MGKIDLPTKSVDNNNQTSSVLNTPLAEGFTVDKQKILSFSSESAPLPPTDSVSDNALELIGMKRFLGIDPMDEKYNTDIRGILQWGKDNKINDKDLFNKVKEIRYKLGAHNDESVARQVYQWLKIDGQIKSLVQKQRMVEYGN